MHTRIYAYGIYVYVCYTEAKVKSLKYKVSIITACHSRDKSIEKPSNPKLTI